MSFDFVPRAVKKRRTEPVLPSNSNKNGQANLGLAQNEASISAKNFTTKVKASPTQPSASTSAKPAISTSKEPDLEQLAALVWLSLSDYAIWADTDLRRKIDWTFDVDRGENQHGDQDDIDNTINESRGYIPLAYLFQRSRTFKQASSSPAFVHYPETVYVKALRCHATDVIDVRLVLSSQEAPFSRQPTRNWSNGHDHVTQTGYEVRVKLQTRGGDNDLSKLGKSDWDKLTIYVENIPIQYRTLPGTLKFAATLLSSFSSSSNQHFKIQNIAFPPHHKDQPNSIPTYKGFALITLSTLQEVEMMLTNWPWDTPTLMLSNKTQGMEPNQALQDAVKFGFRTISKELWENLKAEYLIFRQQLVEEMNDSQDNEQVARRHVEEAHSIPQPGPSVKRPEAHTPQETVEPALETKSNELPHIHAASPYPSGCLVFVRHLHSETNKTTLRELFNQAWTNNDVLSSSSKSSGGIDYLDYTKSMDSCHIRLSAPQHAQEFVKYFSEHPTVQTSGLDGAGISSQNTAISSITAELVTGKREDVYWEKVPERIRLQAVQKALQIMNDDDGGDGKTSIRPGELSDSRKRRGK